MCTKMVLSFLCRRDVFPHAINELRNQPLVWANILKGKSHVLCNKCSSVNASCSDSVPKGSWFACNTGRAFVLEPAAACAAVALSFWFGSTSPP